ncbi:MAG: DNA recombination protein RmuC [Phycisphaerales bacterium]|nr:MAG: DNA recombination protein RmuC [Phycisphaerales bacterium]
MDVWHVVLAAMVAVLMAAAAWLLARKAAAEAAWTSAEREAGEARSEAAQTQQELDDRARASTALEVRVTQLEAEADGMAQRHATELRALQERMHDREVSLQAREKELKQEKEAEIARLSAQLGATFDSLAAKTLSSSTQEFLKLATEKFGALQQAGTAEIDKRREAVDKLVQPIGEALKRTDEKLAKIESDWTKDKATLGEQFRQLHGASEMLRQEAGRLVTALREPKVRGMYGEMQLKRVAELAGMREYCDFSEQESVRDHDGQMLRPDMVVKLPNERTLAVDAKANLKPYLDALEARSPEEADRHLDAFANGIANQAAALARKDYWKHYSGSPEFVVMFVPGDQFVDAALSRRPDLIEHAASQRVILASPSTLIALLRAVHVGFQERRLAEEARELRDLGRELHERAASALEHVGRLGSSLEKAVDHYNRFVGSYESRLEPTLKKFEDAGVRGGKEIAEIKPVSRNIRLPEGGQPMLPGVSEE